MCGPSLSSFAALLPAIAGLAIPLAAQTATPSAHSNSDPTPVLVRSVDPRSNKAEINQVVLVGLIVDANGDPQDVHVVRSIGKELDERAVEAVKQYRFKPAMQNGKPVAVHLNVEVKFLASAPIEILHSAPLELSNEARQAHASGSIEVAFTVDTDGNPRNVHVLHGVGMGMDERAVEAIKQYRFRPVAENGHPVAKSTTMELKFDAK